MKQPYISQPIIRTVPQPSNLNVNGNVFGGWILSQMDIAGGVVAGRMAKGPVATVAIEKMEFHRPVEIGDQISIYGEIEKVGNTSITIKLDVFAERGSSSSSHRVTEGRFIFVAINEEGRPRQIDKANSTSTIV